MLLNATAVNQTAMRRLQRVVRPIAAAPAIATVACRGRRLQKDGVCVDREGAQAKGSSEIGVPFALGFAKPEGLANTNSLEAYLPAQFPERRASSELCLRFSKPMLVITSFSFGVPNAEAT